MGAQTNDKGRQALAFLPNEICIHAGDSITWQFDADEIHTVTDTVRQPRNLRGLIRINRAGPKEASAYDGRRLA